MNMRYDQILPDFSELSLKYCTAVQALSLGLQLLVDQLGRFPVVGILAFQVQAPVFLY
jgi:hypothetical protein